MVEFSSSVTHRELLAVPVTSFNFEVEFVLSNTKLATRLSLDPIFTISASRISGIEQAIEEFEVREVSNLSSPSILPGRLESGRTLRLERAHDNSGILFRWFELQSPVRGSLAAPITSIAQVAPGEDALPTTILRADINIRYSDDQAVIVRNAWPKKVSLSDFNAFNSELLLDIVEFAYEKVEFVT